MISLMWWWRGWEGEPYIGSNAVFKIPQLSNFKPKLSQAAGRRPERQKCIFLLPAIETNF